METKKSLKIPQYFCEKCHYKTERKQSFTNHLLTIKHRSVTMETKKSCDNNIFHCESCNYSTASCKDYNKHITTKKHICSSDNLTKTILECNICNKLFKNRTGLWKHKQKCIEKEHTKQININETTDENELMNTFAPQLFMEVLKQSKELQNVLIEQNEKLQTKLIEKTDEFQNTLKEQNSKIMELAQKQSVVNNTTNNQFNLNFFLNETCKDAMNIVDFVNSLKLTIHDFETTGRLGFVEGISRIFIKELRNMEIEKLPIHCTDLKRETLYIKDNDKWEKENDEKRRLKWAINKVAQLNLNQIQDWQLAYPESVVNNTEANEKFTELALVALGGRGEEQENKFRDKIIRNVLKEVVLDKK
jgi:hypothetical protein